MHDGYFVDDVGITERFTSEWQAESYLLEVQKAVSEQNAADWLAVEQANIEPAEPTVNPLMSDFPYSVGDTVYLEDGKAFLIEEINDFNIQLRDLTLFYPIWRSESRESFDRLM